MTYNLHFEDVFTSIFETIAKSFKEKTKDFTNSILMSLMMSMKNKNDTLKNTLHEISKNPEILNSIDLDVYYDDMHALEDNMEKLKNLAKQHKDKSEIFSEFYKCTKELYETAVHVNIEIGFIEAELKHREFLSHAS